MVIARAILERDLEAYFSKKCRVLGLKTLKLHVRFSRGWPDRLVLLKDGKILWVELKRPGGRVSDIQAKTHKEMAEWGHVVHVIDSKEGIDNVLGTA
jgi:hypothetical protein